MIARPILYQAPMVRALLAGRKTQTRRLDARLSNAAAWFVGDPIVEDQVEDLEISFEEEGHSGRGWYFFSSDYPDEGAAFARCPYGVVGDRLWVKETWYADEHVDGIRPRDLEPSSTIIYAADGVHRGAPARPGKVRQSIFMRHWMSRIERDVTRVRVERLQDISEEDARAEGLAVLSKDGGQTFKYGIADRDGWPGTDDDGWPWHEWEKSARAAYRKLWERINGAASWEANPYVWVVEFAPAAGGAL